MKKFTITVALLLGIGTAFAQVGVNTTNPQGTLHVKASSGDGTIRIEDIGGKKWDLTSTGGAFKIQNSADALDAITIAPKASGGNVTIDGGKLTINGDPYASNSLRFRKSL